MKNVANVYRYDHRAAQGDADTTFGAALGNGAALTLGAALGAPVRLWR